MRALVPRITCAIAAVAVVACRDTSGPTQRQQYNYAIFNADVTQTDAGALTTSPVAYFFRAPALDLPTSDGVADVCQLQRLGTAGVRVIRDV